MEDSFSIIFPIIWIIGVALSIGAAVSKAKKAKEEQERKAQQVLVARKAQPSTTNRKQSQAKKPTKQTSTINFEAVDTHEHHAEDVESYDKIVGSLGDVSTEGCVELDGLRLICNDQNYNANDAQAFDLSKVAQAMVYGEILGEPRCKNPYKK